LPYLRQVGAPTKREIKGFFGNLFGEVHEVAYACNYEGFLKWNLELHRNKEKLEMHEEKAKMRS